MEIFTEPYKTIEKHYTDGVPTIVKFTGQLIFVDMTKAEQEILGFKSDKVIVPVSGYVSHGTTDQMRNAIKGKIAKLGRHYSDQLKEKTISAVDVTGLTDKLSTLEDLENDTKVIGV